MKFLKWFIRPQFCMIELMVMGMLTIFVLRNIEMIVIDFQKVEAASPIDNIHLENWAELYHNYDKSRRPDQEWDETTYGTAFGNHIDAMQDGYDSRTVQQHAVVVIWEAIAATELYHQRREGGVR